MEPKNNNENSVKKKKEKESISFQDIEKAINDFNSKGVDLTVRTTLPITISPEVKKKLREIPDKEKSAMSLIIDLDGLERSESKGKILVSEEKSKIKRRKANVKINISKTPSSITSPLMMTEGPQDKNILFEKIERKSQIKKKKSSKKRRK